MEFEQGYRARTKYVPISPSKVRPIARLIARKPYTEAEALLRTLPHKGAAYLLKTLRSAAANAMSRTPEIEEEELVIARLCIDDGPRRKKVCPRGRGRADSQLKRYAHIVVVLDTAG